MELGGKGISAQAEFIYPLVDINGRDKCFV